MPIKLRPLIVLMLLLNLSLVSLGQETRRKSNGWHFDNIGFLFYLHGATNSPGKPDFDEMFAIRRDNQEMDSFFALYANKSQTVYYNYVENTAKIGVWADLFPNTKKERLFYPDRIRLGLSFITSSMFWGYTNYRYNSTTNDLPPPAPGYRGIYKVDSSIFSRIQYDYSPNIVNFDLAINGSIKLNERGKFLYGLGLNLGYSVRPRSNASYSYYEYADWYRTDSIGIPYSGYYTSQIINRDIGNNRAAHSWSIGCFVPLGFEYILNDKPGKRSWNLNYSIRLGMAAIGAADYGKISFTYFNHGFGIGMGLHKKGAAKTP